MGVCMEGEVGGVRGEDWGGNGEGRGGRVCVREKRIE